jgi:membrane protease YdiL (CAAX protease family)
VLNLIAGAILAPIGEELFFRGFATTAWVRTLGVTRGIIRGGLFFALIHVLQIQATSVTEGLAVAFIAFAVRVPIGLMLGWVFIRRDSILGVDRPSRSVQWHPRALAAEVYAQNPPA